jgi:hypothetical protein
VADRSCKFEKASGRRCGSPPLRDGDFCLWHDPEHAEEVAEARKIGGSRRKRERTVAVAYDFEGLTTTDSIRRLIEIAVVDTLSLDNSVNRNRTLAYLSQSAVKLLDHGEHEDRIKRLEDTLAPRLAKPGRRP